MIEITQQIGYIMSLLTNGEVGAIIIMQCHVSDCILKLQFIDVDTQCILLLSSALKFKTLHFMLLHSHELLYYF